VSHLPSCRTPGLAQYWRGLLICFPLMAILSCASPSTNSLASMTPPRNTGAASPVAGLPRLTETSVQVPTGTPATFPAPTEPEPVRGCAFQYSTPALVSLEYLIGSSRYPEYRSITLDIGPEANSLKVVPREGSERTYPLPASLAQSSLRGLVEYLCGLEALPSAASTYPAHSPDWRMRLTLEGGGDWTITSTGVVLINGRPYTDMNPSNVSDPGSLMGDLTDKQSP
jgi:hypothetical protein